ncbi:hypothetical protein [Microbulbifer variabilis]|nr:hypothetical protein [Microbulbifer variabilis]
MQSRFFDLDERHRKLNEDGLIALCKPIDRKDFGVALKAAL